ncbi:MAG: hypothetical protein KDC33_06280 [Thermoleophilia bacterium]|nr:hypothetical protein [Thermoleophilia bacterium]
MSDHDLGDAAEYIAAERPALAYDDIWAVLNELGAPPAPGGEALAEDLVTGIHPRIGRRAVRTVIAEWRAFRELEDSPDWEDLEDG